jgi:hypothetical protein
MDGKSPFSSIPDAPTLENRFSFIDSENTRQNLAFCLQYVTFLTVVSSLYREKHQGPISLSINRDLIVHTGSIIEACLHHAITKLIRTGRADEGKLDAKWVTKAKGVVHSFSKADQIVWQRQERVPQVYFTNPMSKDINKAAFKLGILDQTQFEMAEDIREARNNIHFIGDDKQVAYPSDEKVKKIFDDTKKLLDIIEAKVTEDA